MPRALTLALTGASHLALAVLVRLGLASTIPGIAVARWARARQQERSR